MNALPNKRPGAQAYGIPADVSKLSEITRLVGEVSKTTDHVDIFFANAGTAWGSPIDKFSETGFDKVYELNVKSVFFMVQKFVLAFLLMRDTSEPNADSDPVQAFTVARKEGDERESFPGPCHRLHRRAWDWNIGRAGQLFVFHVQGGCNAPST